MSTSGPLRIVPDTNVLLASIGSTSPHRWLFDAVLEGTIELSVSTAILLEYEEVITRKTTPEIARNVVQFLLASPHVHRVAPQFRWHLIEADPDDNKFVDAALAAGVPLLVTHDSHFDVLDDLDFPPLHVVSARTLRAMLPEA